MFFIFVVLLFVAILFCWLAGYRIGFSGVYVVNPFMHDVVAGILRKRSDYGFYRADKLTSAELLRRVYLCAGITPLLLSLLQLAVR